MLLESGRKANGLHSSYVIGTFIRRTLNVIIVWFSDDNTNHWQSNMIYSFASQSIRIINRLWLNNVLIFDRFFHSDFEFQDGAMVGVVGGLFSIAEPFEFDGRHEQVNSLLVQFASASSSIHCVHSLSSNPPEKSSLKFSNVWPSR